MTAHKRRKTFIEQYTDYNWLPGQGCGRVTKQQETLLMKKFNREYGTSFTDCVEFRQLCNKIGIWNCFRKYLWSGYLTEVHAVTFGLPDEELIEYAKSQKSAEELYKEEFNASIQSYLNSLNSNLEEIKENKE